MIYDGHAVLYLPDGLVAGGWVFLWWCPHCKTGQIHNESPKAGDLVRCDVCDLNVGIQTWDHVTAEKGGHTGLKRPIQYFDEKCTRMQLLRGD